MEAQEVCHILFSFSVQYHKKADGNFGDVFCPIQLTIGLPTDIMTENNRLSFSIIQECDTMKLFESMDLSGMVLPLEQVVLFSDFSAKWSLENLTDPMKQEIIRRNCLSNFAEKRLA